MNKYFKRIISFTFLVLLIFTSSIAFCDDVELPKPSSKFYIYDEANIIDADVENYIINSNEVLFSKTGAQIVVVTVNSLQDIPKEEYANLLLREWEIGSKEKNNGILMLIAPNEREIRIEVGYGLEGAIPDARAGRILDDYVVPHFQNDDYNSGIYNGFNEILNLVQLEYDIKIDLAENNYRPQDIQKEENSLFDNIRNIFIGIGIVIFIIIDFKFFGGVLTYSLIRMASRGGRGGGSGSNRGGGGSSGGGGAGRGW